MNVRLEAINLLKKIHRGLQFNYADNELKQIAEYLAGKIVAEEKLRERNENLLGRIVKQADEITELKRKFKDNTPKTKAKEAVTYNYLDMKIINEALDMLIGECESTLKNNKSYDAQSFINKINIAKRVKDRNVQKLKNIETEN